MDDASLDEFLDAGGDEADPGDETDPDDEADQGDEADPDDEADQGDGASEDTDETDADAATEDETGEPVATGSDAASPAASTYAWSGEPAACAACGEAADRRWRDGDDLVCADCKAW